MLAFLNTNKFKLINELSANSINNLRCLSSISRKNSTDILIGVKKYQKPRVIKNGGVNVVCYINISNKLTK